MKTKAINSTFFDRNERWLKMLIISLMIISLPYLLNGAQIKVPSWALFYPQIVGGVGIVITGIYCRLTDTISARFVEITIIGGVIALILAKMFL